MEIAVYPGSFNPMHKGHLAVIEMLCSCGDYDAVYLIVSPQNPLKGKSCAASGRARFTAAASALDRFPGLNVRVDDIELGMEPPHYTIRTLDALKQREPGNSFTLAIGSDNLSIIGKWKDYGRILREYGVVVYPREGHDAEVRRKELLEECPDFRIRILDAPRVDISSTEIREAEAKGNNMSRFRL